MCVYDQVTYSIINPKLTVTDRETIPDLFDISSQSSPMAGGQNTFALMSPASSRFPKASALC